MRSALLARAIFAAVAGTAGLAASLLLWPTSPATVPVDRIVLLVFFLTLAAGVLSRKNHADSEPVPSWLRWAYRFTCVYCLAAVITGVVLPFVRSQRPVAASEQHGLEAARAFGLTFTALCAWMALTWARGCVAAWSAQQGRSYGSDPRSSRAPTPMTPGTAGAQRATASGGAEALGVAGLAESAGVGLAVLSREIERLVERHGLHPDAARRARAGEGLVAEVVGLQSMTDREIAESIQWEAEQYIPFDIEEALLGWTVLERDDAGVRVLLVAVRKG